MRLIKPVAIGVVALAIMGLWLLPRSRDPESASFAEEPPSREMRTDIEDSDAGSEERVTGTQVPDADSPPPCRVVLRLRDTDGVRVTVPTECALVSTGMSMRLDPRPSTTALEFELPLPAPEARLVLRAQGYADEFVRLDGCPDEPVGVVLVPEAPLRGRVALPPEVSGRPFTLLAWPKDLSSAPRWVDPDDLDRLPLGVLSCRANADGSFAFRGARDRRRYSVHGGGAGAILAEQAVFATAPKEDLSLRAQPAYCAIVEFRTDSGRRMMVDSATGGFLQFAILEPTMLPRMGRIVDAVLAGLDADWLAAQNEAHVALAVGETWAERAGPMQLSVVVPGHLDLVRHFDGVRVDLPPDRVTLTLTPTAPGFGRLTVRLLDATDPDHHGPWYPIRVNLTAEDGTSFDLFHPGDTANRVVEHVPYGVYRVRWSSYLGGGQWPLHGSHPVTVRVADESDLTIPIPVGGLLELQVVDSAGAGYDGPLDLALARVAGEGTAGASVQVEGQHVLSFETPPEVIRLPESGEWTVQVRYPERDRNVHPTRFDRVDVPEGARVPHLITVQH